MHLVPFTISSLPELNDPESSRRIKTKTIFWSAWATYRLNPRPRVTSRPCCPTISTFYCGVVLFLFLPVESVPLDESGKMI